MRRIRRKVVLIMILCTVLSVLTVGVLSVRTSNRIVDENAVQRLSLLSDSSAQEIDAMIASLEQSVDVLAEYARSNLRDPTMFRTDSAYVSGYSEKLRPLFLTTAQNTGGAMSVYIRYNPAFTAPTSGLFLVRADANGTFVSKTPTDFSVYAANDTEHVGWYYIPVEKGGPTWMPPYRNANIDTYMISYVVPLFIGDICYGVVGMDIDFELLRSMVDGISIYDTGYAFLVDDAQRVMIYPDAVIYTPISALGNGSMTDLFTSEHVGENDLDYSCDGKHMSAALRRLGNGMILVLAAPTGEIYRDSSVLTLRIVLVSLASLVGVTLIALFVISRMLRPAVLDPLTGVNNRQAFLAQVTERLASGRGLSYAFIMLDIDHFKQINDTRGHAAGDDAIRQVAADLSRILPAEDLIGRFGGDEFLVFMQCGGSEIARRRLEQLRQALLRGGELYAAPMSYSAGVVFTGDYALETETLLRRADAALYRAKQEGRARCVFDGE